MLEWPQPFPYEVLDYQLTVESSALVGSIAIANAIGSVPKHYSTRRE